jgi:ribonuclease Z
MASGLSLLRLTFLGTSAAQPTATRNVSGLAVKAGAELILFDCGEGSQRQMIRFGTGFDVDAVFFTHFHADHYLGIIGFLRTLGMLGRERPMRLYGPAPARRLLDQAIHLGTDKLDFPVIVDELAPGDVVRMSRYEVRAVATEHRIASIGYVLQEEARPGTFDVERARMLGISPGPDFGRLQRGETIRSPAGVDVHPEDVLGPPRRGRAVGISGDTRPCASLADGMRGVDLLIHEATFSDEEQSRAEETKHATAREAGRIAKQASAGRLVLTHFSSRFEQETSVLLKEATEEFSGPIVISEDGTVIEVPLAE